MVIVKPFSWERAVLRAIAKTKERIKHCEKHGIGGTVIEEKARLKIQERQYTKVYKVGL